MVIHKNAPRPDLAHQFINFMLEGRNAADLTNMMGSGNPNKEAMRFVKPEIKAITAIFPDEQTAKKLEQLKDMTPQQRRTMNRIWTEIKARGR
jgi:spermidine/putrescine transport system substrate-binding protein